MTSQKTLGEYYNAPRSQDPYARGPRLFKRWTYDWRNRGVLAERIVANTHARTPIIDWCPCDALSAVTGSRGSTTGDVQ
jgi:hypothetical protein